MGGELVEGGGGDGRGGRCYGEGVRVALQTSRLSESAQENGEEGKVRGTVLFQTQLSRQLSSTRVHVTLECGT